VPAIGGFLWLVQRTHGYQTSYLFVPSRDIVVVQIGTWLALLLGATAVAAALWLLVRTFGDDSLETGRSSVSLALPLAAIFLLGLALRASWLDLIPRGFWVRDAGGSPPSSWRRSQVESSAPPTRLPAATGPVSPELSLSSR